MLNVIYLVPDHLQSPDPSLSQTLTDIERSSTSWIGERNGHHVMKWCFGATLGHRRMKRMSMLSTWGASLRLPLLLAGYGIRRGKDFSGVDCLDCLKLCGWS